MPTSILSKHTLLHNHRREPSGRGWVGRLLNWLVVVALALGPLALPLPAAAQAPTPWTPQGPAPELFAQQDLVNVAAADEPVSGNVVSIAASPTDANLVYLGTANGGVWKSTNASAASPTWTPLTDNLKSQSIGVVALDLTDASDQTLVAGTGRFSGFGSTGDDLVGLYYTTNGGTTWTVTTDLQLSAASINGVAARGNTLLATSANGLFRSTSGPLGTWSKISGTGGLPNAPAVGLAADPSNTSRFYVTFNGTGGGIFRTDDGGATWSNVTSGINVSTNAPTCFSVAVSPAGAVYAILNGLANTLYRSPDNGVTWTALDAPPGTYSCTNAASGIGFSADKTNANLVYVASYAMDIYRVDASMPSGSQATSLSTPATYGDPHPDNAALAYDANGALLNGNHGGLFRLANPGSAASATNYWVSANGNLAVSEIHDIAYDSLSNVLVGGFQDNGAAYQTTQGGQTWSKSLAGGDGGDVAVDSVTLATNGQSLRYASAQLLSSFKRYVFTAANAQVGSATTLNTAAITDKQFVTPLALNAVDPKRMLIGGSGNLYESLDISAASVTIASAFPAGATTVGVNGTFNQAPIAYGGYQGGIANPDVFYFGSGSKVYKRTVAGGAVTQTTALPAGASTISDIVMDPANWLTVFAVDNNQVFRTTDGGTTWTDITGSLISSGLSSSEIKTVEFVAGPSPYIAVGTRSGIFASLIANLGTWVELGGSLPDVLVFDLAYDATDDVLAVATLGRGLWLLPTAAAAFVPSSVAPVLALSGPTPANEGSTQYSYSFTVSDPGDRFTVSGPTITGGSLVAGSLVTTGSGGSFKVTFPDGPANATIDLQVTDSTGLTSNTAATNVTVANVKPTTVTINSTPPSPTAGTLINLTNAVIDPSAVDQAAGFTYLWFVSKPTGAASIPNGSGAAYSFTPSIAGTYTVYLNATDKDGGLRQGSKVITVAAAALSVAAASVMATQAPADTNASAFANVHSQPVTLAAAGTTSTAETLTAASANLTVDAASVTVFEGQPAENSGTFAHMGPAPLNLSASVGQITPSSATFFPYRPYQYWAMGEDDTGAADGVAGNSTTAGRARIGSVPPSELPLDSAFDLTRNGNPTYAAVDGSNGSVLAMSFNGSTDSYDRSTPLSTVTDNFVIEAWVRPGVQTDATIVYNGDTSASGWGLIISNGNYAGLYGGVAVIDTGVAATPGVWHDIALVRDSGVTQMYVDGQIVYNSAIAGPSVATGGFAIAHSPGTNLNYFNGAVDDVRVYILPINVDFNPQLLSINTSISGTWSWTYVPDDNTPSQDVTITASTGVSGDTSSTPFALVVENADPSATLSNNGPVSAGSTATVSFSDQSDPSTADTTAGLRYAYDFDNDGVFEVGGDGAYANAVVDASATVPASFLAEGPGTRTVRGRIIDKDGGYTEYTTDITIDNAAPLAAVSGLAAALEGQVVNFVLTAADTPADQLAGFSYSINWGDGSPLQTVDPVAGTGDATASHAYASTGSKTIQVTATDKDAATSPTSGSTGITVNALTASSLQGVIASMPQVNLAPANDAALQNAVAAINGLSAPASPVAITILLGNGPYNGVTLSPPGNIVLDVAGNDTSDSTGTQINGASPAVTVAAGEVFVQGANLTTATDSPTILVTGGHLTLGQNWIDESSGANNAAIKVTGGVVDYGFDVVTNINGDGGFFDILNRNVLRFPEGIDDFMVPNMFARDGVILTAVQPSATSLTSSPAPSNAGQAVTFVATVNVNAQVYGYATGTVAFYEGATLLGTSPLQISGGTTSASFTTSSLSLGAHTITAVYNGDDLFVSTAAELAHTVNQGSTNQAPVAQDQTVTTPQNTPIAITLVATDADNDPLTYSIVTQPAHGTLAGSVPNVTYTPASGYTGSDSFTFKANDGQADSNVATVSITVVGGGNQVPVAVNDAYSTLVNTTLTIAAPGVLSNDSDADGNPLTASKVSDPAHGTLTFNPNGSFTYKPAKNYVGADSFTYTVSDGTLTSNVATVTLTVDGKVTKQIQQVSFRATSSTTTPDPTYPAQSPKGVVVLTLVAKNTGVPLRNVSFRVVKLTQKNYLLNADGAPGQVGSRLSVPNSALPGGNQLWDTTENLTQDFRIGLMANKTFVLQLDVYASKATVAAAEAEPTGAEEIEELVGSFEIEVDPEAPVTTGNTLYLPVVNK